MDLVFKQEIINRCKKKVVINGKEVVVRQPRNELRLVQQMFGSEMGLIYAVELDNEKPMPRYHLNDSLKKPKIVDVRLRYPEEIYGKLSFLYERGYVWLTSEKKGKLFMDMHFFSNDLQSVKNYKKNLIKRRREPFLGDNE